jgi:hypothetical protein
MTNPYISKKEIIHEAADTHTVLDKEFVVTFKPADSTPSVLNKRVFAAGNTVPTNVTYFDDGFDGQPISIAGDGFTTVVHNGAKIATNTGAPKLLAALKVYRFTRFNKVWIEDA